MLVTLTHQLGMNRTRAITALAAGVLLLTACDSSTQSTPEQTVTTEYRKFEHQPQDTDVPSAELDEDVLTDLDDHYFRHLGVRDSTEFYMARTDHEDTTAQGLCFIAVERDSEMTVSQCAGPDELDDMVLHLYADAFSSPVEAFLVPDEAQLELPEGWSQIRRNIVLVTDPQNAPTAVQGQLPDYAGGSNDFTLERASRPEM